MWDITVSFFHDCSYDNPNLLIYCYVLSLIGVTLLSTSLSFVDFNKIIWAQIYIFVFLLFLFKLHHMLNTQDVPFKSNAITDYSLRTVSLSSVRHWLSNFGTASSIYSMRKKFKYFSKLSRMSTRWLCVRMFISGRLGFVCRQRKFWKFWMFLFFNTFN